MVTPSTRMILIIWFDEEENMFYTSHGKRIENIFDLITPNDLFLFRNDHGNCIFQHVRDPGILCEIVLVDE